MKKCSKCKIDKELSEFGKRKSAKDGKYSKCKACVTQYNHQYYNKNAKKVNEKSKKYRLKNTDSIKEYHKQYYLENAESIKNNRKQYHRDNPDKRKQWRESQKDGLHHVYYLPDHNYVGTTDCVPRRMLEHKNKCNRNTDNYQILASFEDRDKALRFESILHDSGFEGRHSKNAYN